MSEMIGKLPMKLQLLHLFASALVSMAADYRTVMPGVTIHSPIAKEIDVLTECECKTKCWLDSGCKAASYDAVADICSMTDGGPDTVTTRPLVDSVAFFKYQFLETPLEVFLTDITKDGTLASQRALCAEKNGVPLIIKTQQAKDEAMKLAKDIGGRFHLAWLSVRYCRDDLKTKCRWPDGTRLIDAVFTEQDVSCGSVPGIATVFYGSGKIETSPEQNWWGDGSPVLCSRNPK